MNDQAIISLIITERCNLSCTYCYEHNKSASDMRFEVAKEILDLELRKEDRASSIIIDFFGGEPFLNFNLMKRIVKYVLSSDCGQVHFFASTNGTEVHGDVQQWLRENRRYIDVGLSADGIRQAHNINRSNSFDKIDFDFFAREYPSQPVKMTISEESLPYLAESVAFLHEKGFLVECNLAYLVDWTSSRNLPVLTDQLNLLIEYYLEHPGVPRCGILNFNIGVLAHPLERDGVARKYCGTGTAMRCYDVNGNVYPCQLFTPISAGENAKKLGEIPLYENFSFDLLDEECRSCYYQRICPTCLGSNYLSTGDPYRPDKARCKLYQIIFQANAKLKALEWERGILKTDPMEEQALLRSIVHIQENRN